MTSVYETEFGVGATLQYPYVMIEAARYQQNIWVSHSLFIVPVPDPFSSHFSGGLGSTV